MEKRLFVQLNGNRKVIGILRGYDVRYTRYPFGAHVENYLFGTGLIIGRDVRRSL
jgi:hypothetical protein